MLCEQSNKWEKKRCYRKFISVNVVYSPQTQITQIHLKSFFPRGENDSKSVQTV